MSVKRGLGKGLGALIAAEERLMGDGGGLAQVDINKIEPNASQPRKRFDQDALLELSESIKEFGVIMPLVLRPHPENEGFYSIVAGERRWRAARLAKLETVPAVIREYSDMETLQVAIIENVQREDLNPIEEALCYFKLTDMFFFKIEDIAKRVGKSRNTVGSLLSLLKLDLRVQNLIAEGKLFLGHGRRLLEVDDGDAQFELALKIAEEGMSLREAEALIKNYEKSSPPPKKQEKDGKYISLENSLNSILGTKVYIKDGKNKGKIEIEYYSGDDLDRLVGIFKSLIN